MYVYGKNSCREALLNSKNIENIFLDNNFNDKELISLIDKRKIKPYFYNKMQLDQLAEGNHQGIIVDVGEFQYSEIDDFVKDNGLIVILDHLEDTHNFGAIIRTCLAAGVDGIIIPKDRSVSVNSTVMKTSSGAALKIPIARVTNIRFAINYLKDKGYWIYASDMGGERYTDLSYDSSVALVIGNEGNGVSDLVKKSSDYIISIPMYGEIDSLNASVAAGIMIYEVIRQKRL